MWSVSFARALNKLKLNLIKTSFTALVEGGKIQSLIRLIGLVRHQNKAVN